MKKILSKNFDIENFHKLDIALKHDAYSCLDKLFSMTTDQVKKEVEASDLRGRGGAGFPTGAKWGFIPKDNNKPVYLVVNADESEPGTFKDRAILEKDPHLLIQGIIIAAYAINAHKVYVYFRGEYYKQWQSFLHALTEAEEKNFIGKNIKGSGFDLDIYAHRGAGAYICGEETSLLNSIEGKRGLPRIRPPYPAVQGLFGSPTIINNVETLSSLPYIIENGAANYSKIGTKESKGTKLISVCGHVNSPGVYEVEFGMPLATFLAECACGTIDERPLKAVIPGGTSVPILKAEQALTSTISYESFASKGSLLGSGGMIVLDQSACMKEVLYDIAKFYHHESCGQCSQCREGTFWIKKICSRIKKGQGTNDDIDLLIDIAENMQRKTICVFSDAIAAPVLSIIKNFRKEFET